MRDIVLLDAFTDRETGSDQIQEIYAVRDSDTEVLFEVDPGAFSLIADYKPDFEIRGNKSVRVSISIGQIDNLGRIVSRYSGKVRVLAPENARQVVKDYVLMALGESTPAPEAD
jgi:proteasome accessory factor C